MTKQDSNTIKGIAILCMIFYHLFHIPEIWNEFSLSGMLFSTNIVIFWRNCVIYAFRFFVL